MKESFFEAREKIKEYLESDAVSFPLLLKILVPIFWEQFFLVCLGLFSIWLLSFDGENSMAVVNMMSVVNRTFTCLCLGLVTGGTVLVAQNIGAKRAADASRSMIQTMGFAVTLTLALGFVLVTIRQPLVEYMLYGADDEIISMAVIYFIGFCVSFPFYAMYHSFAGAMRGWGRSNLAWRITLSVNCIEITLVAVFLIGLKMGVFGVALAMVIARVYGAFYASLLMAQYRNELEVRLPLYLKPDPFILKSMLLIAVPLALEQFFFNSGKAVSQRYIAGYGTAHMAANGVINSVFDMFNLPQITLREALVTVVGMCIGYKRYDLAKRYVYRFMRIIRKLLLWLMPVTIPLGALLVYSFRLSPEASRLTIMCLILIYAAGPPLLAGSLTIPAGLRAGGDAVFVSVTALGCMWCVRVVASYVLAGVCGLGVLGINIAMVLDWIARNVMFRVRLKGEAWYRRRLIAEDLA